MVIVFLLAGALLFVVGYAIYKFFSAPTEVGGSGNSLGVAQNEGQFFDGPGGYDATGGYQNNREN